MHANQIKQMSGPELVAYCGADAGKWAQAFVALHGGDEGLMIGWFANAIETARQIDAEREPRMTPTNEKSREGFERELERRIAAWLRRGHPELFKAAKQIESGDYLFDEPAKPSAPTDAKTAEQIIKEHILEGEHPSPDEAEQAITQALAAARADERRRIVEWLRSPIHKDVAGFRVTTSEAFKAAADAISAQEHNVTPSDEAPPAPSPAGQEPQS